MLTARLQWNIVGRPGYGEGDLAYSETPQFAVGGGYSFNPSINTSSNSSFVGTDLANLNIRRQLAAFGNARQLGTGNRRLFDVGDRCRLQVSGFFTPKRVLL